MYKFSFLFLTLTLLFSGCDISSSSDDDSDSSVSLPEPKPAPIDPYSKYQWNFAYTDALPYVQEGSSSKIRDAQTYTLGEGATIAIIDSCFDVTHEDAPQKIIATYNAETKGSDVSCYGAEPHGISVSGVAGAPANGTGLIGVAPNANFILIKIPMDNLSMSDLVDAFLFAKDHGASVISNSWGTYNITDTERDLFNSIQDSGISIVFACGNDGSSLDIPSIEDECEASSVIGVGSSNEYNQMASYSNYGMNMDLLAPSGEYGIVTIDAQGSAGYNQDQLNTLHDNDYTYFAGTSAAAPEVSGVIALLKSINPSLSPLRIKEILQRTGENINGYPKVNAYNALLNAN
ncbi:MAG: S8 family serine peptidase [Epsilonproteobacteria bacterium]|nr:S8 family serine peptidase [Campylobacterota bacterium]